MWNWSLLGVKGLKEKFIRNYWSNIVTVMQYWYKLKSSNIASHMPDNTRSLNFSCRLDDMAFYYAFVAPVVAVLLINTMVFTIIMYKLSTRPASSCADQDRGRDTLVQLRRAFGILILVGLTWIFGFLAVSRARLAFQYLFSIFNTFQGFCIFMFYCVSQKNVRECWSALLRCDLGSLKKSKSMYTDSYDRRRLSSASKAQMDALRARSNTALAQVRKGQEEGATAEPGGVWWGQEGAGRGSYMAKPGRVWWGEEGAGRGSYMAKPGEVWWGEQGAGRGSYMAKPGGVWRGEEGAGRGSYMAKPGGVWRGEEGAGRGSYMAKPGGVWWGEQGAGRGSYMAKPGGVWWGEEGAGRGSYGRTWWGVVGSGRGRKRELYGQTWWGVMGWGRGRKRELYGQTWWGVVGWARGRKRELYGQTWWGVVGWGRGRKRELYGQTWWGVVGWGRGRKRELRPNLVGCDGVGKGG